MAGHWLPLLELLDSWPGNKEDRLVHQILINSPLSSVQLLLLTASSLAQEDYVDDFSCPDELEGYYPHLYR